MSDGYFLKRETLATFLKNPRDIQQFDKMQRTVVETEGTVTSTLEATGSLRDATYITLSPNAELPNERVLEVAGGLLLTTTDTKVRIALGSNVARTSGGFSVTFTTTGDANVALPQAGILSTRSGQETLANKTLSAPKVSDLGNYADDTAAAAGGVEVMGLYRTGSALKVRVA